MKYTTLVALVLAINALNSDDTTPKKRKGTVVVVSSNNYNSSSNTLDGHQTQKPIIYRIIPQETKPTPPAPIVHQPIVQQPIIPQETYAAPLQTAPTYLPSKTLAPSAKIPTFTDMLSSVKETVCSLNPYTVTAGAVVALYAAYFIKLYHSSSNVMKKNTWSSWKEHIPLEVMLEVPHDEVAEELFNAIKAKYLPANSADLMTPIVKFNNAVDQELASLNQFIKMHEWLTYTKLGYIFPKQEMEIVAAHVKIKRLVFLKDVLLTWMSDYSSAIMHDKFIPRFQHQRVQHHEQQEITPISGNACECI